MRSLHFDGKSVRFQSNTPEPVPGEAEVLIKVHLAGICQTDLEIAKGYMGFAGILGHEFVGTVTKLGKNVKTDWMGKRVCAEINCVCGKCDMCARGLSTHCMRRTVIGILNRDGAFAEFIRVPVHNLHEIPALVTDEEGVFVEPLAAAFQILRQIPIEKRTRVTLLGDGRLGQLIAQTLCQTGCSLTLVGHHEDKLALAEKLCKSGAATGTLRSMLECDLRPARDQDIVVDSTGRAEGLERALTLVRPRGTIVLKTTVAGGRAVNLAPLVVDEVTVLGSRCGPFPDAIAALAQRKVNVLPLITRRVTMEQAAPFFLPGSMPSGLKNLIKIKE
ncbi:MAG TPA: alcohol dehydrogenase catalytic domain-containing protein [Phycisphaerae bacterium]|jgi:threonine dehydrogenase-like Zn-dependent dehydrogenase